MSVNLTTFRGRAQTTQKPERRVLNRARERAWNGDMPLRACPRIVRTGRCHNDILLYRGMDNAGSEAHLVTTSDWPIATVAQEGVLCQPLIIVWLPVNVLWSKTWRCKYLPVPSLVTDS
jgi:hypothetical protein